MTAAARGAIETTRSPATYVAENVHVVFDNISAVQTLQPNRLSELSPGPVAQMAAARQTWARRKRASHIPEGEVKVDPWTHRA